MTKLFGGYFLYESKTGDIELRKREDELGKLKAESFNKSNYEKEVVGKSILVTKLKEEIARNMSDLSALVKNLPNSPSAYKDNFNKTYPQNPSEARKALVQSIHADSIELTRMETHKKTIQPIVDDLENRERNVNEKRDEIERLDFKKGKVEEEFQVKAEDEERKKGLLDLLLKRDMAKQFAQIIVISHGEQLKDEFPHSLYMDRGKAISSEIL